MAVSSHASCIFPLRFFRVPLAAFRAVSLSTSPLHIYIKYTVKHSITFLYKFFACFPRLVARMSAVFVAFLFFGESIIVSAFRWLCMRLGLFYLCAAAAGRPSGIGLAKSA